MEKIKNFLKAETVLVISFLLAVISVFFKRPSMEYAGYIDFRTLSLLFCLMVVTSELNSLGVFSEIAEALLAKANSYRQLTILLVCLCFFSSMIITNDVALITFVPFSITLFQMANLEKKLVSLIVLETIAANLGSMFTPLGNPQNLYLYGLSGMTMKEFLLLMLKPTLVAFILLMIGCFLQSGKDVELSQLDTGNSKKQVANRKGKLSFSIVLFFICLLSVFRVVSYEVPFAVAVLGSILIDRKILKKPDYSLLFTFVFFFIFIGNMKHLESVCALLENMLRGRELITSFLCSQIISNVPAAVLLSGFTGDFEKLILGVNIGGLGTLIASMASLISYKLFVANCPEEKGRYFGVFTGANLVFAVVLLGGCLAF
ncbi:MAG: citrate transporter [Lachnospiraceae bacterium]|nr:citrate transporter [Lachnospiraceae bacterium]